MAPPPFPLSPAAANESGVVSRDQLKAAGGQVSGTRTWAGPAGGGWGGSESPETTGGNAETSHLDGNDLTSWF